MNTSAGTRLLQSLFDDVLAEKPLPGLLRKALMLAKVLDAQDLREWLETELYGYESKELPTYRFVNAPIMLDADLPGRLRPVEEQIIPSAVLPQPERGERFTERVPIALPVGTLVETANMCAAEKTFIKLSPPHAPVIAQLMNARDTHGQRVTALYWAIQPFLVFGLLDTVRTMLADYVAELYADADAGAEALPQQARAAFTSTIEPFINIIGATNVTFIGGDSTTNKISNKGNGNYIVAGSTDVQINTTDNDLTKVREFAELAAGLAGQLKMPDQEREQLQQAAAELAAAASADKPDRGLVARLASRVVGFFKLAEPTIAQHAGLAAVHELHAHLPELAQAIEHM